MDIARGLLMVGEGESLDLEDVIDALGECANMVSGALKCKALDPFGEYTLGTPRIDNNITHDLPEHAGSLVYRLSQGAAAIAVWLSDSASAPPGGTD